MEAAGGSNTPLPGYEPGVLSRYTIRPNKTSIQLGNNSAEINLLYVGNSADTYILAAETLYKMRADTSYSERVDGEAFFVTNDEPYSFWDLHGLCGVLQVIGVILSACGLFSKQLG